MNTITPKIFIAATRQNDGKTTTSLGLLSALRQYYPRIGYIKPVGQRFVEIDTLKIDEDTVLMDRVYKLDCPLESMNPIAVVSDFTRRYLESSNYDELVDRIRKAYDRVAWEKDFVLCEGSGHAGVGSVFDLSNARIAKIIGSKAILVTRGGIGKPIDEIALNQALFEKEGVEIMGVVINKVLPDKLEFIRDLTTKALARRGLDLLGVIPREPVLSSPTLGSIRETLRARPLNRPPEAAKIVKEVVVGAMGVHNAMKYFRPGVLLITPGDREDILFAVAARLQGEPSLDMTGIVLTGNLMPNKETLKLIEKLPIPVLLSQDDSYEVASKVHDIIVKTGPEDAEKIQLIRDLIARHVDVTKIVDNL